MRSTGSVLCSLLEKDLESTAQHRGAYWLIVNRLLADLGLDELKGQLWSEARAPLVRQHVNADAHQPADASVPAFLLEDIDYDEPTDFETLRMYHPSIYNGVSGCCKSS